METSVKQRLEQFIKYRNLTTRQFELKVGLSNGYVRNIRKSITQDKLEQITHTYPELSKEWLIFGEGDMVKCYFDEPNPPTEQKKPKMEDQKENSAILEAKDETIRTLKSQLADKDAIISAKEDLIRMLEKRLMEVTKTYHYDLPLKPIGLAESPLKND